MLNHKPTFLHQNKPLITCMVQESTERRAINKIRNGAYDGADAIGFQMECLPTELQTPEVLKRIYAAAGKLPLYVTNYRSGQNVGKTDEELCEGLMMQLDAGATLVDVMGDMFCPTPGELTTDPAAIEKQKAFIDQIHQQGGEVLMSSHVLHFIPAEEVLAIAKAQQERGADIAKIVTGANSEEEEFENLRICTLLKKELDIPFLFLAGGSHYRIHRTMGPVLGACMWLTVPFHDETSTPSQPVCRAIRAIADHFDF